MREEEGGERKIASFPSQNNRCPLFIINLKNGRH